MFSVHIFLGGINMQKTYTLEFKNEIIQRYIEGETVSSISRSTKLSRSTIYNWLKDAQEKENLRTKPFNIGEFHKLNVKCQKQQEIIKILQTSPCSTRAPLLERYNVIKELSDMYSVNALCSALKVAKGSYYNHILRNANENTQFARKKKELTPIIEEIYNQSKQTYGAGRIQVILKERGYKLSTKTVSTIMQENNWFSIRSGAKSMYEQRQKRKENILQRQFTVSSPNEVWVSDITYFRLNNKTYYICVILDLYARKVIAYNIALKNSTQLTKSTFKKAYYSRNPKNNLLFHSDQGSNYVSKSFMKLLKDLEVTQSFSKAGTPYDNSVMESFFKTLKAEELYRTNYKSEREFKKSIDDFIKYYNSERIHTVNNYRTPNDKETNYFLKYA